MKPNLGAASSQIKPLIHICFVIQAKTAAFRSMLVCLCILGARIKEITALYFVTYIDTNAGPKNEESVKFSYD